MHQLDAKLNELKEWKDFAVAPKRAELIAEMEGLIGSSEPPQALADRIKQLQEQWKGHQQGNRQRLGGGLAALSPGGADGITQPCREYFEAQARQRRDNLEKRKTVVERLKAFEERAAGTAGLARRGHGAARRRRSSGGGIPPVERAAGRAVQAEFDAAMGRLTAQLDAWQANNVAEKKALIQRGAAAARQGGRPRGHGWSEAAAGASGRRVGTAPRDQEQALWNEFRAQCDAVFQKRQQAYSDYTAGLEVHKAQAQALCTEIEQAAAGSGAAVAAGDGEDSAVARCLRGRRRIAEGG